MSDAPGELWLSRLRLRQEAPLSALARLLVPEEPDARVAASHRLVWSLFGDHRDRRRDFLWREERPGHFLTLSSRQPHDEARLFEVECRPFEPVLAPGDRLRFSLRANPVVSRPGGAGQRGKRHDVVMDVLRHVPSGPARAAARPDAILSAGHAWLRRQGEAHGFRPADGVAVDGYDRRRIPRDGARDAVFGVLDLEGVLTVEDPALFLSALAAGFGRARAFGCGLMLIRRAR